LTLSKEPLQPVVIRFGRLGDMIMLSSVLRLLHLRFGSRCLVLGAGAWNSRLFHGHPDVAGIWSFTRHFPFVLGLTWWRVLWALRRSDPSPIYVCERSPRQLARIRRMLALSGINQARCLFITDVPADVEEHWIDQLVRFGERTPAALNAADYPVPVRRCNPAPHLRVLDAERAELQAWLNARGWVGRKLILIQPGNFRSMSKRRKRWRQLNADDKAWPIEKWISLLQAVHASMPDALLVLCGAPQEGPMLQQIRTAAALTQIVVAELPLRQLLALCESAHSMISVDSGPAHAAAALGLPVTVMYGAELQRRWLPRSPSDSAVIGIGGPPLRTRVDQIAVNEVFNAWCALLPRTQNPIHPQSNSTPLCPS
jgi:ADP-heptose:LPS heptosyltransferase